MKKHPPITYVKECLRHEGGKLYWNKRPREHFPSSRSQAIWNARYAGKEAGCIVYGQRSGHRRWQITLDNAHHLRHVVVWAIHNNEWRVGLDHKNRNPLDDRIENLRPANQSQNNCNARRRCDNSSGYKGVCRQGERNRWQARITKNGKTTSLGGYASPAEAHAVYARAAQEHFGEFAYTG